MLLRDRILKAMNLEHPDRVPSMSQFSFGFMNQQLKGSGITPCIISCHSLRHSRAMHLLQSGVNIVYIRDLLGHTSTQTTDIYARADSKQKREALEKAYMDLIPEKAKKCDWERNQGLLDWLKSLQK